MKCNGCGNEHATRIHIGWALNEKKEKERYEICNVCGQPSNVTIADVYFERPYFDEHLATEKKPFGQYVNSRSHKAQILKELNLVEMGGVSNKQLGKPMPFIKDPDKRRKFMKDNFGA